MRKPFSHLLVAALVGSVSLPAFAASYTITTLAPVGSGIQQTIAFGINGAAAVGYTQSSATLQNTPVIYSGGSVTPITPPANTYNATAEAISSTSQVVGFQTDNNFVNHPVTSTGGGAFTLLPTLAGGSGIAYAVNTAGTVVGKSVVSGSTNHAFMVTSGATTATDLGLLLTGSTTSQAMGINTAGTVVGYGSVSGASHAFSYSSGVMTDLNASIGGTSSQAIAINTAGEIVGNMTIAGVIDGFSYANGVKTDLGTLGTNGAFPLAVNDSGIVVGYYSTLSANGFSTTNSAFVYIPGTGIFDLTSLLPANSGWSLQEATGINSAGDIVGYGTMAGSGASVAFELAPVAVPEPASLALLTVGGLLLARRTRR